MHIALTWFYIWASAWDFQQCGLCDQQRLRPACAYAQSDQSLCLSLDYSMSVKLLTEHHLELLSLTGGCRGSSKPTHVKMPHCWKSHALAHMEYSFLFDHTWFCTFTFYSHEDCQRQIQFVASSCSLSLQNHFMSNQRNGSITIMRNEKMIYQYDLKRPWIVSSTNNNDIHSTCYQNNVQSTLSIPCRFVMIV